ncbi:MAG: hypothetical protein UV64_C0009G0022 [Parcubacteria group bacterium GW2011_GWC1_43_11b]|uniref:DUF5671 domain-containing protein n=1 Tax=Candidatus Vogelbacteria bacterium RIFOXYB1_FULL_42_16 TaxID=1802436 RepID=A0A1G2QH26_9BACT|nr:MAG: hypothetical protein UV50_C0008G0017 [Parcubacteria group bacterium GW2011_GWB1_42_9]KKS89219.1 MAG: hypothetical protein UV64_C0009G0022 [Parcubacteria group bacterium GW2011_GWC1_43_11b]KKT09314.1 MAG: hypothetical protein UV88_C0012G0021 [Parcubacteria group bacterium GW2011_GWA1_43_21]OHA59281.1 MAG: hypothetical protein A2370_01895 [Candidatus Vogelbacteria bacterium RIFOXYB1_FULL_42_16]
MKQQGIVKLLIIILVAVILLSYFGINIRQVAESDVGHANFGYLGGWITKLWTWLTGLWGQFVAPQLPAGWR